MPIHVVKQGDCLHRIAQQYGFADWHTIYDHPDNEGFRELRPNPNTIFPGDEVHIPDPEVEPVSLGTGSQHQIRVKRAKLLLRLAVHDELGEPLAGKDYELKIAGDTHEGTTDGDGIVEQKVNGSHERGELTVWLSGDHEAERYFWNISIGHLDPVEELSGVRQRLNNLGFYCEAAGQAGDGDDELEIDESLRFALTGFQHHAEIDETGEADDATLAKLVELHGDC